MKPALKSAVIGTGAISEEHLLFLRRSRAAHVVGVCDLSPAAADYAAARVDAAPFTDYRAMLDETRPDVVHVLTPPHTHVAVAGACLEAGAHVIVEKPVAPTNDEFRHLWSIAQRCNRALVEDHNYRFNEAIVAIEKMVADGELGDVQEVEVRMALAICTTGGRYADANLPHPSHRLPAGVIHEFLPHMAYLALRFLPSVDRVAAAWSNHGDAEPFMFNDLDAIVLGGNVHARLRFSARTQPDCFCVTVRGSRGYVDTDLFQPHLRCVLPRRGGRELSPLVNQFVGGMELIGASFENFGRKIMQRSPYEGMHALLGRVYDALQGNGDIPVTYNDMDRTTRLIDSLVLETHRV